MKTTNERVQQLHKVQEEAADIFERKNQDYGDAFAKYGPVGVIIRMGDKIDRLASITKKGVTLVDDESLRDTALDLMNYSCMLVMLMDEKENND